MPRWEEGQPPPGKPQGETVSQCENPRLSCPMRSGDKENWDYNNRETGYIPAHGMLCQSLDGFERDVRGRLIRGNIAQPRAPGFW